MPRHDLYLRHLATVPVFSGCSDRELATIARCGTDLLFDPGQTLIREGRPGYEFFVIVDGTAAVTRNGDHVATLGPGTFFGELALLHQAPRNATVTAVTPLETIVVQSQQFRHLLREVPGLTHTLNSGMARRLHDLEPSRR